MDAVLGSPVVVLIAASVASLLYVVEVALPTVGLAGTAAIACSAVAVAGIAEQEAEWWPLTAVAAAIVVWSVLIARRDAPPGGQALAGTLFGAGAVGFGALAADLATILTAVGATVAVTAGFRPLFGAAARLGSQPPAVGIEALVGRRAEVVEWSGTAGTVRVDGSLWKASGDGAAPGATVLVDGFDGFTLHVATTESSGRS